MTKEDTPKDIPVILKIADVVNCKCRRAGWCTAPVSVKCTHRIPTSIGDECKSVIE